MGVDDVGFVRAMAERLSLTQGIDPTRLLVLGCSNGGYLAHRLAAEFPTLVRAVAVVGANLPVSPGDACAPSRAAVPTLLVAGTADVVNPWRGGTGRLPNGDAAAVVLSAAESATLRAQRVGASQVEHELLDSADARSMGGPRSERTWWLREGRAVAGVVTVRDGGHELFSRGGMLPPLIGRGPVSAVRESVRFFLAAE